MLKHSSISLSQAGLQATARVTVLALTFALVLSSAAAAFSPANSLDSIGESEREVLDAIAARDADTRDAALLATLYPDTLVRIELIQARSSAAFDLRVKQLDREHQEEVWELVRAQGAMEAIVEGGPKSKAELDRIAARYPERIRAIFGHLGDEHFETLQDAHAIQASAEVEFEKELASLPDVPRDAFRDLLADPELLAMLGRSPSAVSEIGDAFDEDADATLALVDKLALEVAESNAQSEEEWRNSFGDDPEAQADLERAARSYADEYGYDYDELTRREVEVNVQVHQHAYPYWFGFPHWYASWDPWGVWYPVRPHFGFYYGHGGLHSTVFFGLPSLHFVNWYYNGHYGHYPHLSRHIDYHHSRYAHAYRPLHRHHRLHRRGEWHQRGGRNWAPARLSPRAIHAADRRETRRERGIERRETRRDHMSARRQVHRENGIERRSTRRENGTLRRDERRENMTERRDGRRERAAERKSDRTRTRVTPEVGRRTRPGASADSADSATSPRTTARSSRRDSIETRMGARREARTSRVAKRSETSNTRSVARRSATEARIEKRSQARATRSNSQASRVQARSTVRARPQRVARAEPKAARVRPERSRAAASPRSTSRREPAAAPQSQRSSPTRERAARAATPRPTRERAARPERSRVAREATPRPTRERAARPERSRAKREQASGSGGSRSSRERNRGSGGGRRR